MVAWIDSSQDFGSDVHWLHQGFEQTLHGQRRKLHGTLGKVLAVSEFTDGLMLMLFLLRGETVVQKNSLITDEVIF